MIRITRCALRNGLTLAAVLLLGVGSSALPQKPQEIELQSAIRTASIDGDLKSAIQQLKAIVAKYPTDRVVAAKALLRLADCYRILADAQSSRAAYERVLRDFSDQREAVAEARDKLPALGSPDASADLMPRVVARSESFQPLALSIDGRIVVGHGRPHDPGGPDLAVMEIATGRITRVIQGSDASGHPQDPRLSPDSRRIAFMWFEPSPNGRGLVPSLRVANAEASAVPKVLVGPSPKLKPMGWSSDGQRILALTIPTGETPPDAPIPLVWVSAADGRLQPLTSFPAWSAPADVRLSNDGRLIAYTVNVEQCAAPCPGPRLRRLSIMDVGTQRSIDVTSSTSLLTSVWAPDNRNLIFTKRGPNGPGLWAVSIASGVASDARAVVESEFGGTLLGINPNGALYFSRSAGGGAGVFVAESDARGASVIQTFAGSGPAWSPDGRSLAFIRGGAVVFRSLATGVEHVYPVPKARLEMFGFSLGRIRWFHDSASVLVASAADGTPEGGSIFRVDAATGTFTRLAGRHGDHQVSAPAMEISPDDRTIYVAVPDDGKAEAMRWRGVNGLDVQTSTWKTVVTFPENGLPGGVLQLALSPDGKHMAVQTWTDERAPYERGRLLSFAIDGGAYDNVADGFTVKGAVLTRDLLQWTRDGLAILFATADVDGSWRLMRVPKAGGRMEPAGLDSATLKPGVSVSGIRHQLPLSLDVNRDGSRMVFGALTNTMYQVWTLANVLGAPASKR